MANRTIRSTSGALLNTIGTVADVITDVVENIGKLSDIASFSLDAWRDSAKHQSIADIDMNKQRIAHEMSLSKEQRHQEVEAIVSVDKDFRLRYDEEHQRIMALFA